MSGLEKYLVGGAVRDRLLGRESYDQDWVVVGATSEEMLRRGFKSIGKQYPVFLEPGTNQQHALARTERKIGKGHAGFLFDANRNTSLEMDLYRRDLTINAMAQTKDGRLIDPFNGRADLENRVLRHVSDAFVEDPLRVFRVARFAAQLPEFSIATETQKLMCTMQPTLAELPAERVWIEYNRAVHQPAPARFFQTVHETSIAEPWFASLDLLSLTRFVRTKSLSGTFVFASVGWIHNELRTVEHFEQLKAPKRVLEIARFVSAYGKSLAEYQNLEAGEILRQLTACTAFRPGTLFEDVYRATERCSRKDLSSLRELVERLTKLRVDSASGKEYGCELKIARIRLIEQELKG